MKEELKPQKPAEGILKEGSFGDAMFYYVQCDCGNEDCAHTVEVEADDLHVMVNIYSKHRTKWYESSRWKQIWDILTKGYTDMETTIVMKEQTAMNYSHMLKSAALNVKTFRKEKRNAKTD